MKMNKIQLYTTAMNLTMLNKRNQTQTLCLHSYKVQNLTKIIYAVRSRSGTSLVVQWLRIQLPIQGTQVRSLVREDPTCHGATRPVRHNY